MCPICVSQLLIVSQACVSLEENYMPRVTFAVVQKRHHTRLFPADHRRRDQTDRSGNIMPGFTFSYIDDTTCHLFIYLFLVPNWDTFL